MKRSRTYSGLLTLAVLLFILSFSIAVPLFCRPFFYAHIKPMKLETLSGYSEAQIRDAYDEMMDFCMWGKPFGTGDLAWSREGMEHFADCAKLFRLDLTVLLISSVLLLLCLLLHRRGTRPVRLLKRGPFFWGAVILIVGGLLLTALAAMDFDRAFVVFHHIFFPGKTNWLFDPYRDEIIMVLPEEFFRNCAILVVSLLLTLSAGAMLLDKKLRKNSH